MNQTSPHPTVAVIGLGPMGRALARTLLTSGLTVTVWNRSARATTELANAGARVAGTAAEAVAAGDLVLVCLRDHAAVRSTLHDATTTAPVVNLTSATPDQARATAHWAAKNRLPAYVTAAIMVPVPLIGDPRATILYSGDRTAFEQHRDTLTLLAGDADFLGEDHGLAPLFDVGMLEVFYAGMTSFLHASAVAQRAGVSAATFLPYAGAILRILPETLAAIAHDVDTSTFSGDEDRLSMELASLEHIVEAGHAAGLDTSLAESLRDLAERAVAAGDGDLGWSKVFDHLQLKDANALPTAAPHGANT